MIPATVYSWEALPEDRPMDLITRKRIIGSQMMISRVVLSKGCSVPSHAHPNEQFACIVSGRMRFGLGTPGSQDHRIVVLGPGEILHLPSNLPHSADAEEESVVLDLFSSPSATTGVDRPNQ